MISREAQTEIERMFAERKPEGRPIEQRRAEWEAEALMHILPVGARFSAVDAGGVPAEWMDMPGSARDRVFLLLHGGGYRAGSPRTHRRLAANFAAAMGMRVLVPDYRLAPEHPFPAGVEDAAPPLPPGAAHAPAAVQGPPPAPLAAHDPPGGGDAAGGGLALSMLLALREAGAEMPRAAVLLAPWTDLTVSSESYERLRAHDPIITRESLLEGGLWYAGTGNPADPLMSPLFADLAGLPPMLIHAGEDEVMVDDSRRFAQRALDAGVDVTCKIFPGMWHVFHGAGLEIPEAQSAFDEIGDYVRALFGR